MCPSNGEMWPLKGENINEGVLVDVPISLEFQTFFSIVYWSYLADPSFHISICSPNFVHYTAEIDSWKTQLPPVLPLQLWLPHRCLHWSSGSMSFVYWASVLLALRCSASLLFFLASADGCATKALDRQQSPGRPTATTRSTGSSFFSGLWQHSWSGL